MYLQGPLFPNPQKNGDSASFRLVWQRWSRLEHPPSLHDIDAGMLVFCTQYNMKYVHSTSSGLQLAQRVLSAPKLVLDPSVVRWLPVGEALSQCPKSHVFFFETRLTVLQDSSTIHLRCETALVQWLFQDPSYPSGLNLFV